MLCNLGKLLKNTFTSHSSTAKACSTYYSRRWLFYSFCSSFFPDSNNPIFDLVKFRKLLLLINILTNPSAPSSFKQMFKFLSCIRQRALTRACAYDLQPPFPRTDSGKWTFLYSASIILNCLDSDCKELAASPYCSSYTNAKQKIRKILLNKLTLLESELEFRARFRARILGSVNRYPRVVHPVVIVQVKGIKFRALLDSGASNSFVSETLVSLGGVKAVKTSTRQISTLMGATTHWRRVVIDPRLATEVISMQNMGTEVISIQV
jgi:hypothetical protein